MSRKPFPVRVKSLSILIVLSATHIVSQISPLAAAEPPFSGTEANSMEGNVALKNLALPLLNYPGFIARKPESELKKTEQAFKEQNGTNWSIELNPYTGLIYSAGNMNFKETGSPISKEESQRIILDFLNKNREFFGLAEFRIEIDPIYEGNYEDYAYVIEPHQTYKNLFVARVDPRLDSAPHVSPDNYKNRISLIFRKEGNGYTQKPHLEFYINYLYHYPEIEAPLEPRISQEEAVSRLCDYEFEYPAVSPKSAEWLPGMQPVKGKFGKGKNTFKVNRLVILPWPNKEKTELEFRLVWQIETGMQSAYVDAITGEVVALRQNFVI